MSSGGARAAVSAEIAPASAMPGSVLQCNNLAACHIAFEFSMPTDPDPHLAPTLPMRNVAWKDRTAATS